MFVNADIHKLPVKIELVGYDESLTLRAVRYGNGTGLQGVSVWSDSAYPALRIKILFGLGEQNYIFADGLKLMRGEAVPTALGDVVLDETGQRQLRKLLGKGVMGIRQRAEGSVVAAMLLDDEGVARLQQRGIEALR